MSEQCRHVYDIAGEERFCELPKGHTENHRAAFKHGIVQWPGVAAPAPEGGRPLSITSAGSPEMVNAVAGALAQSVEHQPFKLEDAGSIPRTPHQSAPADTGLPLTCACGTTLVCPDIGCDLNKPTADAGRPALRALVEKWRKAGDEHEARADAYQSEADMENYHRQDAFAYAARLHADKLAAMLGPADGSGT